MTNPVLIPPRENDAAGALSDAGAACFVSRERVLRFGAPREVVVASRVDEVQPALRRVEAAVARGCTAAGYVAYEAAPAFDAAMRCHAAGPLPLVWFALYEAPGVEPRDFDAEGGEYFPAGGRHWRASVDRAAYDAAVTRIRDYIAAGHTYQVNYTYPLEAPCDGDPLALFRSLLANQGTDFGAYLNTGAFDVLSVSPELFFRLDGDTVTSRPMKGTAARGLWYEDDCARAAALRASEKERAENVMIVDMVRNDLGRIARTGTVRVESLFDAERYDTVWQMTSTVTAETVKSVPEIFAALFPSASVTGAPKVRTMEIIRELEPHARGVYCGAVGWWGPGRRAEFSVGIRTMTVDKERRAATYPVGSGITWDSVSEAEYDECRLKAEVLHRRRPRFDLLESLLWDGDYFLLEDHLDRLEHTAVYFRFTLSRAAVLGELRRVAAGLTEPSKVRLLVSRGGGVRAEAEPLVAKGTLRIGLAPEPVERCDPFLYHKTTQRAVYERIRALRPDCDDVVLWNEQGELTESTSANVVVRLDGRWYTPPVACGLLPGVMRGHLLRADVIEEAVLPIDALERAEDVKLINSVRAWIDTEVAPLPASSLREG